MSERVGGRYEVHEVLASGGMGTVHRGFDRLAQRAVAYKRIKVTRDSSRSRIAALFTREYETLSRLAHPNIVEVFEFGIDAYGPYYTMELLSGDDLARLAPLPIDRACSIVRDVASALALLHARRLVHRDVSPTNVRLTGDGRAKLIDFGGLTPFGTPTEVIGTPIFIAPECLSDSLIDGRADLYALGALAYWTLTGKTHIRARTIEETIAAWAEPLLPPSRYLPELPKALDELILSLLQPNPLARPATAAHVIERLTSITGLAPEEDEQKVAYSYLQYAPLRGREEVLDELRDGLAAAAEGCGGLMLIACDAGLGRSALLDQLAVEAQLAGATVLRAQGNLHSAPFSAARSLVELGAGIFPDVSQRKHRMSSHFDPAAGGPARAVPRTSFDLSEQQARNAGFLHDQLIELSARNTLVLLVDDAHAIDAESLALFASMLEDLHAQRVLLVLSTLHGAPTYQPQAYTKLAASAKLLALAPLTASQTIELVVTMFGGVPNSHALARWLYDQAGGNPALIIDLTHQLLSEGKIRYTVGTFTLPFTFSEVTTSERHGAELTSRLVGLGPHAAMVAGLLAAHAGVLTAEQLVAASGLSMADVLRTMGPLAQRGIAVVSGEQISCASESQRTTLRSVLPREDMRAAHCALARAFAAYDQEVLEVRLARAHHLIEAGGEEALAGARLLALTKYEHRVTLASSQASLALLERALRLLQTSGCSDIACLGLLIPLSAAGFYGEIQYQQRYLDRTMRALSRICGIDATMWLTRFVGPRLGLVVGLLYGLITFAMRSRKLYSSSFLHSVESFASIPAVASAATAVMWNAPETNQITRLLDPFAHASPRSMLRLTRAFCMANTELQALRVERATRSYGELFEIFEKPVFGLDEVNAEHFRCGCLHGLAQALVSDCAPKALEIADQLQQRSTFFAPHAEGIRTTYHAYRGEEKEAAMFRARAEALAFRGGTSWSALGLLTLRSLQACILTCDVVGLVHAMADMKRFSMGQPHLEVLYALTEGHLEQLRGHPERALPIYARAFDSPHAIHLPSYAVERALHAQARSAVGDFAGAKALCLKLLEEIAESGCDGEHAFLSVREQLALAEANLGHHDEAVAVLEPCFARARRHDNPRSLGGVHRARALVAALAGDKPSFEEHFAAMSTCYRTTHNPGLLQQCDLVQAQAARLGVAASPFRKSSVRDQGDGGDLDGSTEIVARYGQSLPVSKARAGQ